MMISMGQQISSAALLNALELERRKKNAKIIVSGAGSAALACKFICTAGS
jgi:malic enzyme